MLKYVPVIGCTLFKLIEGFYSYNYLKLVGFYNFIITNLSNYLSSIKFRLSSAIESIVVGIIHMLGYCPRIGRCFNPFFFFIRSGYRVPVRSILKPLMSSPLYLTFYGHDLVNVKAYESEHNNISFNRAVGSTEQPIPECPGLNDYVDNQNFVFPVFTRPPVYLGHINNSGTVGKSIIQDPHLRQF
jgi:hypothetical protein